MVKKNFKKPKTKTTLGKYVLLSAIIIGASIVYYSIVTTRTTKEQVVKLEKILEEIKQTALPSPSPMVSDQKDESLQKPTQTPTENLEKSKEICLEKLRAFEQLAISQNYPQEEINQFINIGKVECNNPSPPKTSSEQIKDNISDLEDKVNELLRLERGY